jgi:hydrophobic/amphiphilic exporter-1 (mainly G- bacteria), HAE1 family
MKFSHFFVSRPIFASVLSIVIVLLGAIAFFRLPVSQYPDIAPPSIAVTASYPGASSETVADTVATPLEQEINGVENMLYMNSFSTSDGQLSLTVTFKIGTNLDDALVFVQNRINQALPRLPEEVRRLGVVTTKSSNDLMMVVHLLSPDDTFDQLYISNYALLRLKDSLARLAGVGQVVLFGAREYALRVWLDPDRMATLGLTASEVVGALREQNVQISGGVLGQPPVAGNNAYQLTVNTQGRFTKPEEFADIIVKAGEDGRLTRVGDVARVELGARDYGTNSYLDNKNAVAIAVFQRPGTNALQTADDIKQIMQDAAKQFPKGLAYEIVYNPTDFIRDSVDAVYKTIFEAIILVMLVVLVFLQSWRAALIPILAIPVSLIGTFMVMAAFGFSLNTLTLFGLVLAIGIVVDDAIVVVENIERNLREGLSPRMAAYKTMDEVGTAVIAIALVLSAVFIPTAFIPGISGQFYQQFALTIAGATIISAFNSLTLSPALGALLLRPHTSGAAHAQHGAAGNWITRTGRRFADGFNQRFDIFAGWYGRRTAGIIRRAAVFFVIYLVLLAATGGLLRAIPTGFIPTLDKGYSITVIILPPGSSLARTDEVTRQASEIMKTVPGVVNAIAFAGFNGATFTNASNAAAIFARFDDFDKRIPAGQTADRIIGEMQGKLMAIQGAFIFVIPPPPVEGIGTAGGFKMMVQDRGNNGLQYLEKVANEVIGQSYQTPGLVGVFTTFNTGTPQIFLEIDRTKARMLNVPLTNVFETLQIYLGSAYVNDFNVFGRAYQVTAQAEQNFRLEPQDIGKLKTKNAMGELVPLGTIVQARNITGPDLVNRYNLYPAVAIQGNAAPGISTGTALEMMEGIAAQKLPNNVGFEWTELALQEKLTGNTAAFVFLLAVILVFLVLAAQYESWSLPLAIILIVPMSVLSAMLGVLLRGMDNNILTQVGLVVLIGLAAKNAILIVEFARQMELAGRARAEAVIEACRLRLRPILMTSFAFILGVVPLMLAQGAGAEMRQALGTAVFFGMLGVTFFGLVLTPVFYMLIRNLADRIRPPKPPEEIAHGSTHA